jgi:Zn-dependent membrane protease YugP
MADDPVTSLVHQMVETKERTAAWFFRGLTTIVMIALAIIGWFVQDKLGEFNSKFSQLDQQRTQVWKSVGDITASENKMAETMVRVETTLSDHIATENNILDAITREETDHENRIRGLEHPH